MTEYVLSFIFDKTKQGVALIRKNRPEFQKDKLNGIGGKVEQGETPLEAAVRELKEEANLDILMDDLKYVCSIIDEKKDYKVYVFTGVVDNFGKVKTMTDEQIVLGKLSYIGIGQLLDRDAPMLSNLPWLLEMCKNVDRIDYKITNDESILCSLVTSL